MVAMALLVAPACAWCGHHQTARHFSSIPRASSHHLPITYCSNKSRDNFSVRAVQATTAADIDDRPNGLVEEEASLVESASSALVLADSEMDVQDLTKSILNGIFLAVCFGWAAYTILTIDAGMTRGWTQSEIAMRIPLDNWSNYESSLMEKPIFTKTLINVVIYLLGDWLSQTVFQKKDVLDFSVSRTLKNGFIGLCFGPLVHEYYQFSDHILPVEGGLANRIQKIFMDQTIYLTVKCSIYISAVGLLSGDSWETSTQTVKDKIGGVVITAWKFWPLVHCITYGVIPARHRILWVNSVDLIWNAILATQAQKAQPETEEESEAAATITATVPADKLFCAEKMDTHDVENPQPNEESVELLHKPELTSTAIKVTTEVAESAGEGSQLSDSIDAKEETNAKA
ncbi:Protein SYM1 [Seminavis robusta]|uniref:Protein SYM1 n=1 Tax=Seminavis robusta TaxID=568900 RepID=A0A9N8DLV2_9STRA|nr:Protein SYM1 [Seminavis robusta]|eukprot:Sro151_g069090.1 Protein SYM1 (401) ;mRNA; r:29674-30980